MSIESLLERIAVALEAKAAAPVAAAAPAARGPGRPPKPAEAPAPAPEPVAEADPFAVEEAAPVTYTKEQVRAALVAYQKRTTAEKARGLLKTTGGVDTLGALPEDKFAAVIKAAEAGK